jgi:vitamin B12 transporter
MYNTKKASGSRMRMMVSLLQVAGIAITLSPMATAEVEQELDTLVLSADRMPTDAGKVTASVTVLDPENLRERGVDDLISALNESPGVIATSTAGQTGAVGSLLIRGTTTAYSQIVVDGIRLSDATAQVGGMLGSARIDDVDRIEVLRGAQSAFYGGEAVGGVIWMETAHGSGDPSGRTSVEAGSYGTASASTSWQGAKGPFSWFLSGGAETTQNDAPRNDYDQQHYAMRLEQATGDHMKVGMTFRAMDSTLHYPDPYSGDNVDHLRAELVTAYAEGEIRAGWQARFTAGYYQESYDNDSLYGNYGTDLQRASLNMDHAFDIAPHHRLLAGAFYDHTDFTNTIGTSVNRDRYGAHVGWEWSPTDRITTNTALRWENYSNYGDEVTWRAGASWRMPVTETRLVAGVGRAFRPPNYLDLYGSSYGAGNPTLRAESGIGWDVGLEQPFGKNTTAAVTFFRNGIEDRIQSSPTPPVNLPGTTFTDGIETSLRTSWCDGKWTGRLAWTWLGKSLQGQPDNVVTTSLDWKPVDKLMLGAGVSYVGARSWGGLPLNDYLLARFYGSYKLTESVSLHAHVENAFNENYQLSNFYGTVVQGPGTGIYAGLTVDW